MDRIVGRDRKLWPGAPYIDLLWLQRDTVFSRFLYQSVSNLLLRLRSVGVHQSFVPDVVLELVVIDLGRQQTPSGIKYRDNYQHAEQSFQTFHSRPSRAFS